MSQRPHASISLVATSLQVQDPWLCFCVHTCTCLTLPLRVFMPLKQVFNVPGRCFPVDVIHSQDEHMQDYSAAAIDTALQIHLNQPEGEIVSGTDRYTTS